MRSFACLCVSLSLAACGGNTVVAADAAPDARTDAAGDARPDGPDASDAGPPDVVVAPPKPLDCTSGCTAFIFSKLLLGEIPRSGGAASPSAWKAFGHDIDGKVTDKNSTDVCIPAAGGGSQTKVDGNGGIDNAFGANVVPIIQSAASLPLLSAPASAAVANGTGRAPMLVVSGLGQGAVASLPAGYSQGMPLGAVAAFDGNDLWPVSSQFVQGGDATKPLALLGAGPVAAGGEWDTGRTDVKAMLAFPAGGLYWTVPLGHVRITGTFSPDRSRILDGNLSAVIDTEAFVQEFKKYAGSISLSLCSGSTIDGISHQFRQVSDILQDGTQDPTKPCNAISLGLGFEATAVKLGPVVNDPVPPNPCN